MDNTYLTPRQRRAKTNNQTVDASSNSSSGYLTPRQRRQSVESNQTTLMDNLFVDQPTLTKPAQPYKRPTQIKPIRDGIQKPTEEAEQQNFEILKKELSGPQGKAASLIRGLVDVSGGAISQMNPSAQNQELNRISAQNNIKQKGTANLSNPRNQNTGLPGSKVIQRKDSELSPEGVGQFVSTIAPYAGIERLVGGTLAKAGLKRLAANQVVKGAIAGSVQQGVTDLAQGKSWQETVKDVMIGAGLGAAADIGLGAIGKLISGTPVEKLAKEEITALDSIPKEAIDVLPDEIKSNKAFAKRINQKDIPSGAIMAQKQNIPVDNANTLPTQKQSLKRQIKLPKSEAELPDNLYDLQRVISDMESAIDSDFPIDLQLFAAAKKKKEELSKLYSNTLQKSNFLTDAEKAALNAEDFVYDVKSEVESLANARKRINFDIDGEIRNLSKKEAYTGEDFDTAMEILKDKYLTEARESGDYTQVKDWLKNIRRYSTESGRAVQAHAKYSRTPEGMAAAAQRAVDKVKDDLQKTNPKKFKKLEEEGKLPELTDEDLRDIVDSMEKYQQLPEGWEKEAELYKAKKKILEKIPPTWMDKYKGLQRISWLLNPKTLLARNPLGNTILQLAEGFKDVFAAPIDAAISLKTKQRTTTLPSFERASAFGKGLKEGTQDVIRDAKAGVRTSPTGGQVELTKGDTFKNGVLRRLDNAVSTTLQLGDRPFYQAAYNERIAQLKKINKSNEITEAMKADANDYALERTFQDDTGLSKAFARLKNISDHPLYQFAINTTIPFSKTPANILNKLIEYSPAGFLKSMVEISKFSSNDLISDAAHKLSKGEFNQKRFVDNIGRSLTGTGIMALGYAGAKNGFITGKADKDKEVAAIERLMGIQPYAFQVDGKSYTFDWAQPVSVLLAIGADAYNGGKSKDKFAEQLQSGAEAAGNTFFNMSMLQGVTKMFNQYNPVTGLITSIASGAAGLANPTALTQTARTMDPYVRETDGSKINQFKSKIPGLSQTLPPKLDSFGQPIKQNQGRDIASKALENYLSPGYFATDQDTSPAMKEVYKVYKSTGLKDVFPRLAPKEVTWKGEKIKLSLEERQEFQKIMGEENLKRITQFIDGPAYKILSDEKKAKRLKSIVDSSFDRARKKVIQKQLLSRAQQNNKEALK